MHSANDREIEPVALMYLPNYNFRVRFLKIKTLTLKNGVIQKDLFLNKKYSFLQV
jgi:hypothetical protein